MTTELLNIAQNLFVWMLALSTQLAVILLIRKPLARYFGATVAYRLWLLPLLWLPLQGVDWSQFDWSLPALSWGSTAEVQGSVSWFPLITRSFEAVLDFPEQAFSLNTSGSNSMWLAVALLWFGVAGVLITSVLLQMWHFSRQLPRLSTNGSATPGTIRKHAPFPPAVTVRTITGLGSPALYGVLRPQLLLPADFEQRYNASQRSLILAHEAVHYRRRDNLWNLLACSLRLLFWFNPLLHLAWRRYRLDQEMSCDEQALQQAQQNEGRQYARTLLDSVARNSGAVRNIDALPTLTSWGRLSEIKERTSMIHFHLHRKPHTLAGNFLLLPVLLALVFFTTGSLTGQLEQAVAAEPQETLSREAYALIQPVMVHREKGEIDEAELLLDELQSMYEDGQLNNREALVLWQFRANIAQMQSQHTEARAYYVRVLDLPNLTPEVKAQTLMQLGTLSYLQEDYEAVIDYDLQYLETTPKPYSSTHLRIAYSYWFLEEFEQAIPHIETARSLGDSRPNTLKLLQDLYQKTGQLEKATELAAAIAELEAQTSEANRVAPEVEESAESYLPIVTIPPQYPLKALRESIEGWAQVSFTVDESGDVVDPIILSSAPEDVFEEASLTAISGFKFIPRMENGVAVPTPEVHYVFRFHLNN